MEDVVFVGKVPNQEVKNYCRAADLFVFCSLSETQGIVLLESMAAGTPVIAVKATGVSDVVINGENGYMTDASEVKFAEKIMDVLEKKELEVLSRGARRTAEEYRGSEIAKRALSAYAEAILIRQIKEAQNTIAETEMWYTCKYVVRIPYQPRMIYHMLNYKGKERIHCHERISHINCGGR